MKREVLHVERLAAQSPGVPPVTGISFTLRAGECAAVMGLDNSGKNTLCNLFAGRAAPLAGRVLLEGTPLPTFSREALEGKGIFLVGKQKEAAGSFTIAEYLFLLRQGSLKKLWLDKKAMHARTEAILRQYGSHFSPDTPVASLTQAERDLLAIAKALDRGARLLVVQNLTAAYSLLELNGLLGMLQSVKNQGVALLLCETRLEFFWSLAEQVLVMRERTIAKKLYPGARIEDGYAVILGPAGTQAPPRAKPVPGPKPVFRAEGLRTGRGKALDIRLRPGEILQISCFDSADRQSLWHSLCPRGKSAAAFYLDDEPVLPARLHTLGRHRILCGDCAQGPGGLFDNLNPVDNIALPVLQRVSRLTFYSRRYARLLRREHLPDSPAQNGQGISGLRQEDRLRLLLTRWQVFNPRVLLLHNAFSSADVLGKRQLQQAIYSMAARGTAVVLLESDILSTALLAHRLVVVQDGALFLETDTDTIDSDLLHKTVTGT